MTKRVVKIDNVTCHCCPSLGEEVFCAFKAAGLALRRGTEILTQITEWETCNRKSAPPQAYFALYLALFRDASEESAAAYVPGYETILNAISVRHGAVAARSTLMVLHYANESLGAVLFPSDI